MIPNFFSQRPVPKDLPQDLLAEAENLKSLPSKDMALRKAYDLLTQRYHGSQFLTFILFWRLFETDIYRIWSRRGFLPCTTVNWLLRILLVKSGQFSDDDIEQHFSMVWYVSPHQYLSVRIDDETFVNVDIWGARHGVPYDEYARGFR